VFAGSEVVKLAGMHSPLRLPVGRSSDFIIHVYSCNQWVLKGSAIHVQSGRRMLFHSILEMVLVLQAKMDENGFPQSSTARRRWQNSHEEDSGYTYETELPAESEQDMMPESILASFLIRVQFRQNATWQGTLIWMERKESCAFRSSLELMTLIADAMRLGAAHDLEFASTVTSKIPTSRDNLA